MTDLRTDEDLRALAELGAARAGDASADELLRWTDEHFGGHYVVASNMQDAVLVDLAAKVRPGVDVLFLDTGYHFVETIGTRDAVEAVYDINVVNVTPQNTVAEQDELFGKDLFARDPAACCRMRKVEPLGKALRGYSAWVTGHSPRRGAHPRQRAADQLRQRLRVGEDQPDRGLVRRGHAGLHRRQRHPGQSAGLRGLPVDRLRSVHRQARRGRRPAQRPVGRTGQDGMRSARLVTAEPALILAAHGSADPRSAAVAHALAGRIRRLRPWLDVRAAFLEHSEPNLSDVLDDVAARGTPRWSFRCCWPARTTRGSTSRP